MAGRSCLRHCATCRKVAGSIPDVAIFINSHFLLHYVPRVDSPYKRKEYQNFFLGDKGGRCVGLTTLTPSCDDCLEIWEFQPPETLTASPGLYRDCFTFTFYSKWRHSL